MHAPPTTLSIHLSTDTSDLSVSWLLSIMQLWTWGYRYLFKLENASILVGKAIPGKRNTKTKEVQKSRLTVHDRRLLSRLASLCSVWYFSRSMQLIQMLNECVVICRILWVELTCGEFLAAYMWFQNKNVMVYFGSLFQILSLFSLHCGKKTDSQIISVLSV